MLVHLNGLISANQFRRMQKLRLAGGRSRLSR
jgi:hypothetical protein